MRVGTEINASVIPLSANRKPVYPEQGMTGWKKSKRMLLAPLNTTSIHVQAARQPALVHFSAQQENPWVR